MAEEPNVVYGRLLEAAHIGGYAAERVASEFKWLLTESRWKQVGPRSENIDEFLAAINLSQYRISVEDRKEIVKLLDAERATQRAAAKALGVNASTINRDVADATGRTYKPNDKNVTHVDNVANATTSASWFETPPSQTAELLDRKAKAAEIREERREELGSRLAEVESREVEPLHENYDVIVIDPPWPMEKIERDVTPNQVNFDYPVMTESELLTLDVPAADDCHVWLWTTHKFLPVAFRLLAAWGLKYVCTFVWHKPGGFQPFNLPQYNCEFALYARRGSPPFVDTKQFPTCFEAARGAHSEKPEIFYEILRRVTSGRRLDMFNRRKIDGFKGWGKESA